MHAACRRFILTVVCLGVLGVVVWVNAGTLDPPAGPIGPTMKDLDTVEPRIPVPTLSGSATAKYEITQPGSYYFTGDVHGEAGKHGIAIDADNVTLDLMGYALHGGTVGLYGVVVQQPHTNIKVRNGTIRDWPNTGLWLANTYTAHVSDLHVANNGGDGIYTSHGAIIERCSVNYNGGYGINVYSSCVVKDCSVMGNTSHGILAIQECLIVNCTARYNEQNGFNVGSGTTVKECSAVQNYHHGIVASGTSYVLQNTCRENGYTTNDGAGIYVDYTPGNRIEANNVVANYTRGIDVEIADNLIIRNVSGYNSTINYDIAAGNAMGPIVNKTTIATNTNPHANYEY